MTYTVHEADVLEALRAMDSDSYHGALSDPPYGLTTDGGKTGFMGHAWDKGVPPAEVWREVLRVLKPGAYLLAFGGTRTFHRLTCAIEDAGFEIRDSIAEFFDQDAATQAFLAGLSPAQRKDFDRAFVGSPIEAWIYASGFPKSHDVSKAIDREAGAVREVVGKSARHVSGKPNQRTKGLAGSATFAESVGMGSTITAPATPAARQWSGYGTSLKPAFEPVIVARKPLEGTVAKNVQRWGCGALAIDACRVEGVKPNTTRGAGGKNGRFGPPGAQGRILDDGLGRWPANVVLDEEAGAALDAQSGKRPSASNTKPSTGGTIMSGRPNGYRAFANGNPYRGENGGASRFFYCAKASRTERDAGLDGFAAASGGEATHREDGSPGTRSPRAGAGRNGGSRNVHPTVKPLALAAYLARLILPPVEGSRLLVPFCGSGSEMIGGLRAGWSHVEGIDSWDVAVKIARARLAHHEALLAKTEEAEQLSLVGT